MTRFAAPIAEQIWNMKYRYVDGDDGDASVEDTWRRIARSLAQTETEPAQCEQTFFEALEDFKFLPAGRITAGAGTGRKVTLFNCFVMGTVPDDMGGIFDHLREAALTMQQGGGIGYDFSTIRPKGAEVKGVSADASGPLSFMDVWDAMCRTIMSAGQPPGRDDGDHALRPPRYRGVHRRQVGRRPPADVQPQRAGHRCLHGGGQGRRPVGADIRRPRLSHRAGARPVEPDHAGDL